MIFLILGKLYQSNFDASKARGLKNDSHRHDYKNGEDEGIN